MMSLNLGEFAKALPGDVHTIMVLDGTGWHDEKGFDVPADITLVAQPSYSPELNPVEQLWLYLSQAFLPLRVFVDQKAIIDGSCYAWRSALKDPDRIRSFCDYPWIQTVTS